MTTARITAARAVNAHPWLHAALGEDDDTELVITPLQTPSLDDPAPGHFEGRITWTAGTGRTAYTVALAYEGPDGTVEDQTTTTVPPGPLAWVDLAREIAERVEDLRRLGDLPF